MATMYLTTDDETAYAVINYDDKTTGRVELYSGRLFMEAMFVGDQQDIERWQVEENEECEFFDFDTYDTSSITVYGINDGDTLRVIDRDVLEWHLDRFFRASDCIYRCDTGDRYIFDVSRVYEGMMAAYRISPTYVVSHVRQIKLTDYNQWLDTYQIDTDTILTETQVTTLYLAV